MRLSRHPKKGGKKRVLRLALVVALAVLPVMQPGKAMAQYPVFDPWALAETVLQYTMQGLQYALQQFQAAVPLLMGSIQISAHQQIAQDQQNGQLGIATGVMASSVMARKTPPQNWSGCNRIVQVQKITTVQDVLRAIKSALNAAMVKAGAGGADPVFKATRMALACQMGLLSQGPDCPNSTAIYDAFGGGPYNDDRVFQAHVVTDLESYPWPSVLKASQGQWVISGTPQPADMPALAAIFHCVIMRPMTATPPNTTGGSSSSQSAGYQAASVAWDQKMQRGVASANSDACLNQVAERLAIGSNASAQGMQQAYNEYLTQCNMLGPGPQPAGGSGSTTGTAGTASGGTGQDMMSPQDYANCTNASSNGVNPTVNGVSYLVLQRTVACPTANPAYINDKALNDGADKDTLNAQLDAGIASCKEFYKDLHREEDEFQQVEARNHPIDVNRTLSPLQISP